MNDIIEKNIPTQTLKRMPFYLHYLEELYSKGIEYVSTPKIAMELHYNEMSVKKDLAYITSESGKPKVGHKVVNLINGLMTCLGYNNDKAACLVGVGNLGKALVCYKGFSKYRLFIKVAFDKDNDLIGKKIGDILVLDADEITDYCKTNQIPIGIITVTAPYAQEVCDKLVAGGCKAIWNFAPTQLVVPDSIIIQNENMASSLAVLSSKILNKL